jgi:hypothetical protein
MKGGKGMMELDLIRRDAALQRRERTAVDKTTVADAESMHSSFRRLAEASVEEIELLIFELQRMRGTLHSEGERLNREITRYAGTNQSLFATINVIRENAKPIGSEDSLCIVRHPPPFQHN